LQHPAGNISESRHFFTHFFMMKTPFQWISAAALAVVLAFLSMPATAQHTLGFSVGLEKTELLDQNTSVLPYKGFIPQAGLQWQHRSKHWQSGFDVSVGRGHLQAVGHPGRSVVFLEEDIHGVRDTVRVPVVVPWTPAEASFYLLRSLTAPGRDLRMSAGGMVSDQFYYSDGFVRPGLMHAASVAPRFQLDYRPEAGRMFFSAGITATLAALVTRMRYDGTISQPGGTRWNGFFGNTTLHGPDKYRRWTGFVQFGYQLTTHWQAAATYRFERSHDALPRPLDLQQQKISATLSWTY
jgi:hypothetical protein